jgi:hypothetical protein
MSVKSMSFEDCYTSAGFTGNPFTVYALQADDLGRRLMVGRDDQVQLVGKRLHKHGKITCLDGHVGVGKTSLVNVAAYRCLNAFLSGDTTQLLIPLNHSFQLGKDDDVTEFCERVFRKIAAGLLAHLPQLTALYSLPDKSMAQLNAWLHSPVISHINDSLGASFTGGVPGVLSATFSGGAAGSSQTNTGAGFAKDGVETLVRSWLDSIFKVQGSGGVICVIDNLELLESGPNARRMLELLRDRLFNINGIRWVFCGANGVILSLAASERLGSFLNTPIIDVKNIKIEHVRPLIEARLNEYAIDPSEAELNLPILMEDIVSLYKMLNFNLRDLLAYVDEYCEHQINITQNRLSDEQKSKRFDKWLRTRSIDTYKELLSRISNDAWIVLDIAMGPECKGTFGVGDYQTFSSNSKIHMTKTSFNKWLKSLEKLQLISKYADEFVAGDEEDEGFKRDVFTVTAKGSLVHYARLVRQENQAIITPNSDWLKRVYAD